MLRRVIVVLIVLFLHGRADAVTVTLSDGTFNDANWSVTVLVNTSTGSPSGVSGAQQSSGGNPGAFRQTTMTDTNAAGGPPGPSLDAAHLNSVLLTYDPATQGAIISLNVSFDLKQLSSDPTGYYPALFQGGSYYGAAPGFAATMLTGTWVTNLSTGLTASSFSNVQQFFPSLSVPGGAGPVQPDFSSSGAPIIFGYLTDTHSCCGAGTVNRFSGIDNLSFTLNAVPSSGVPEPSSVILLGLGASGIAFWKARRWQRSA